MIRLVVLSLLIASCDSSAEDSRAPFLPSVEVQVDCRALPFDDVAFWDARNPDVIVTENRVTTDGGQTWHAIYDGVGLLERVFGPIALGGGRWFFMSSPVDGVTAPAPYMLDGALGIATPLALTVADGPAPGFRRASLADGSWVGVSEIGQLFTSTDGTTWTPVDSNLGAFLYPNTPRGIFSSRGARVYHASMSDERGNTLRVSTDGGDTFTTRAPPDPALPEATSLTLGAPGKGAVHFGDPLGSAGWLFVTEDEGVTWRLTSFHEDFMLRAFVVWATWLDDGTLIALTNQNVDAADGQGAGLYLVRSRDDGRTWERLLLRAGDTPVSAPSFALFDAGQGRITFQAASGWCTSRLTGRGTLSPAGTLAPARVRPAAPELTSPASDAKVEGPRLRVEGTAVAGNTVRLDLRAARTRSRGSILVTTDFEVPGEIRETRAGPDGRWSATFDVSDVDVGGTVVLAVTQRDGWQTSPERRYSGSMVGTPVTLALDDWPQDEPVEDTFDLLGSGTPGASLDGILWWCDANCFCPTTSPVLDTRCVCSECTVEHPVALSVAAIPDSHHFTTRVTLPVTPPEYVGPQLTNAAQLVLFARLPNSIAMVSRPIIPGVAPESVPAPTLHQFGFAPGTPGLMDVWFEVAAPYARWSWEVVSEDLTLASSSTSPMTLLSVGLTPRFQVELSPSPGAHLTLKLRQSVMGVVSPDLIHAFDAP